MSRTKIVTPSLSDFMSHEGMKAGAVKSSGNERTHLHQLVFNSPGFLVLEVDLVAMQVAPLPAPQFSTLKLSLSCQKKGFRWVSKSCLMRHSSRGNRCVNDRGSSSETSVISPLAKT